MAKQKLRTSKKHSVKRKVPRKPIKANAIKRKKKVLAVPKGYHSITPYLTLKGAKEAIAFYKKVFNAKETLRLEHAGKIMHAELKIGDMKIMLADECPEKNNQAPSTGTSAATGIHLYVKKVDDIVKKALATGATLMMPVEDMFWGDRAGKIEDPFGHCWFISTHIEDVTPKEIKKRAAGLFAKQKK